MSGCYSKFISVLLWLICPGGSLAFGQETPVALTQKGEAVEVRFGADLFTIVRTNEFAKPILYPVLAPGQIPVTRSSPMAKVAGEADDHPHHKSIWFAHGDVNGVDFWSEKGSIKTSRMSVDEKAFLIHLENDWSSGEKRICRDETTYSFGCTKFTRWIDFEIMIFASESELCFGDTKEGLWAIRTRPGLQLTADPKDGVVEVFGKASNSEGDTGTAIWGKKAKWVLYEGKLDGVAISMVMMDHPDNLRHPTTWHARDYGLVAANPFGRHDFLGEAKGAGEHRVAQGQLLRFRYRILFANTEQHPFDPSADFQRYVEHTK
jgi:hypothetical protein